jgi:hypothetical protein
LINRFVPGFDLLVEAVKLAETLCYETAASGDLVDTARTLSSGRSATLRSAMSQ